MGGVKALGCCRWPGSRGHQDKALIAAVWMRLGGSPRQGGRYFRQAGEIVTPTGRLTGADGMPDISARQVAGVWHVGIRYTLWRALAKLLLRSAGDQAKVTYKKFQLSTRLEE